QIEEEPGHLLLKVGEVLGRRLQAGELEIVLACDAPERRKHALGEPRVVDGDGIGGTRKADGSRSTGTLRDRGRDALNAGLDVVPHGFVKTPYRADHHDTVG